MNIKQCERCGSCCTQISGFDPHEKDIIRWVKEGRDDILQYCSEISSFDKEYPNYWVYVLFFGSDSEKEELIKFLNTGINSSIEFEFTHYHCPFLRKARGKNEFECRIQETKPEMCKNYFCEPKDMKRIVKKPFAENLAKYRSHGRL